jgi:hypothetical protein
MGGDGTKEVSLLQQEVILIKEHKVEKRKSGICKSGT